MVPGLCGKKPGKIKAIALGWEGAVSPIPKPLFLAIILANILEPLSHALKFIENG